MRFSKFYKIGLSQPELDFVDIELHRDMPLFIDPYALSTRNDEWSINCRHLITSFFQSVIDRIRSSRPERAQFLLNQLTEPNETRLGFSRSAPRGRGVSGKQAFDLYRQLAQSRAAQSGILTEMAECDLFVEGIGRDKISDMTTNVVRSLLIEYTQEQCKLHGVALKGEVASGRMWDAQKEKWGEQYVALPIVNGKKVILVPKYSVRWTLALDGKEYYNHFALNHLQAEHLQANSSLVKVFQNGKAVVRKKDLKELHPFNKDWLAEFSEKHPTVLKRYKENRNASVVGRDRAAEGVFNEEDFDETIFARSLREQLAEIPPGKKDAYNFHKLIAGILEFLFWPYLIYPTVEFPIHEGRKKIDITYTNAAETGFFKRLADVRRIPCGKIMVECKNYFEDPSNPETDQIAGRFSINRGQVGILACRSVQDENKLLKRCRDTAGDGRGFIIVLGDKEINAMLTWVEKRDRKAIDLYLDRKMDMVIN